MNDEQIEEYMKSHKRRDSDEKPAAHNDEQGEEVTELKRALAVALTENHAVKAKLKEQGGEFDENTVSAPGAKEIHSKFLAEMEMSRETRALEQSGIPYSIATKIVEATRAGNFELAGKLMDVHHSNETAEHLEEIKEAEANEKARSYFGLSHIPATSTDDSEMAKWRRAFGLR